ncbi:MAP3K12-binding inhibitory protein 1 isoform X1 [Oncorhynchus keta]|uniref:MAP3K12-binding inhibitory protein 1 isoform X1 n=1 Tax=Oncorhynchus keta TaxID=8018 RepID=UPI00227C640B|nr:MAP3K12-binding inhibitory protein 1 isoform X1 [Oncorhynchus keta]
MADRMKLNDENGVCDKQRGNVAITSSCKEISSYRDSMLILLNLLTDFGSELKLGEAALKISASLEAVDVSSLQPTRHVFTCLQQHISKLQSVSDNLRVLVEAEDQSSSSKSNKDETTSTLSSDEMTIDSPPILPAAQPTRPEVEEEGKLQVDDLSIQIRANKSEIDRRISAFIERKQLEINENNVREFCNVIDCNQEDSCARTDAVFTPYPGFKSHVKVTRVVNTYGPQTRRGGGLGGGALGEAEEQQRAMVSRDCGNPAIEERLHNIETHLKLPTEGPVPLSVYQRLKKLEDRILELEGLSPEYFQSSYLHKRPKTSMSQVCSLSELDVKISAVKAALLKRMGEFGPVEYDTECPL